jgi:hypothetical protein
MRKTGRSFFASCVCCQPSRAPSAPTLSRRNLLSGGIAALGLGSAATVLGAPAVLAQARTAPASLPRIDVHHHFLPPAHAEALTKHQTPSPKWSPAMSLEEMDRSGIQTSILSQVRRRGGVAQAQPRHQ